MEGGDAKIFSWEGVLKAYRACKACQANVGGLFCILEAYQGEGGGTL